MRILVAMSGGVDSSVAAALLVEAGHEVVGVSMQLYDRSERTDGERAFGSCCTIDDLHDARRVAAVLGIPHYIVNFQAAFETEVISNFVREYAAGRTPIPCVHCNGRLKFARLAALARALGAEGVATGHYARVDYDAGHGRYLLRRGVDAAKDQSYFLFTLDQAQLAAARFPVGTLTKAEVRAHARRLGLPVADKPDSREICFVPPGEHAAFVERHLAEPPQGGLVRDAAGRPVGRHGGVHRFTVGQRKGLGLAAGVPLYVIALDAATQTVTVGPRAALERTRCTAARVNWISGEAPAAPRRVTAQIRYRHREAPARIELAGPDRVAVEFDEPQSAITPGQAIVFYEGDAVVGGGWIE
jgi:tRNA-specific 2-thiouridylase